MSKAAELAKFIADGTLGSDVTAIKHSGGTSVFTLDSSGRMLRPNHPAFLVHATAASNLADDTTIAFGTEIFDQGDNFASNTFTAPVTGRYQLNVQMYTNQVDYDGAYAQFKLITSNRNYLEAVDPGAFDSNPDYWSFPSHDRGGLVMIQILLGFMYLTKQRTIEGRSWRLLKRMGELNTEEYEHY